MMPRRKLPQSSSSSYPEIRALTTQLLDGKSLSERRAAGRTLQERLARCSMPPTVWQWILSQAIVASHTLATTGKHKIQADDVLLPYTLLRICTNQIIQDPRLPVSNLSKKVALQLFQYCCQMLAHPPAVQVAHLPLLQFCKYLCNRADIIGSFKGVAEFNLVLEIVQERIFGVKDIALEVAHIWSAALETATRLGIGLHSLLPEATKLVSTWCSNPNARPSDAWTVGPPLLDGWISLSRAHPEHSIASWSRHGKPIRQWFQRECADANFHSVAQRYRSCHLYITQVAGMLEGTLPGDVGSLGPDNTLTYAQWEHWLEATVSNPRDDPLFAARLVAMLQREYLAQEERNALGPDQMKAWITFIEEGVAPNEPNPKEFKLSSCSSAAVANAPFFRYILARLYHTNHHFEQEVGCSPEMKSFVECLPNVATGGTLETNEKIIHWLNIVSACAEEFPGGSCWISASRDSWRVLHDDERDKKACQTTISTPTDLAWVVHVVANVLRSQGMSGGDTIVQQVVLSCLMKLTFASGVQSCLNTSSAHLEDLQIAWRRVWDIIFDSELRYVYLTRDLSAKHDLGNTVLALLVHIVKNSCTDPFLLKSDAISLKQSSFLYRNQSLVWSLPAFSSVHSVIKPALFDLITVILQMFGLANRGRDALYVPPEFESGSAWLAALQDRRYRLLAFCISHLRNLNEMVDNALAAAMTSLVSGCSQQIADFRLNDHFDKTKPPYCPLFDTSDCSGVISNPHDFGVFGCLWKPPFIDPFVHCLVVNDDKDIDRARIARCRIVSIVRSARRKLASADEISTQKQDSLIEICHQWLDKVLGLSGFTSTRIEPIDDFYMMILYLKVRLAISLTTHDGKLMTELERITSMVGVSLADFRELVLQNRLDKANLQRVSVCIGQILKSLVEAAGRKGFEIPLSLMHSSSVLFDACLDFLRSPQSVRELTLDEFDVSTLHSLQGTSADDLFDDDEQEQSDIVTNDLPLHSTSKSGREHNRTKRKHDQHSPIQSKRPRVKHHESLSIDDTLPLVCVAGLALVIDSGQEKCEAIICSLLGLDGLEELDNLEGPGTFFVAMSAVSMCCTPHSLYNHSSSMSHSGKVSTASFVVDIINVIRSSAGPGNPIAMYGVGLVSMILNAFSDTGIDSECDSKTAQSLIGCLMPAKLPRALLMRPVIRACQFHSIAETFMHGNNKIHAFLDNAFPKEVVIPSLTDLDGTVRRCGPSAVSAAVKLLDEDKVIPAVRRLLPPLFSTGNDVDDYQRWSENLIVYLDTDEIRTLQAREDAFLSIRSTGIGVAAALAHSVSDINVFRDVLFDILLFCARGPVCEYLGVSALEEATIDGQRFIAEKLIRNEMLGIFHRWLRTGKSLFELPLIVTSPSLFSQFRRMGYGTSLCTDHVDLIALKSAASSEFICTHCYLLLPMTFRLLAEERIEASVVKKGTRTFLENNYMRQICSVFDDRFDDVLVKEVVRTYLADIVAFCAALQCGSDLEQNIASEIELLIKVVIAKDSFHGAVVRNINQTTRRIIDFSGSFHLQGSDLEDRIGRFIVAIETLAGRFGFMSNEKDLFRQIDSTSIDLLLLAGQWFESAGHRQKQLRCCTIELLCRITAKIILDVPGNEFQLDSFLHILVNIVLASPDFVSQKIVLIPLQNLIAQVLARIPSNGPLKKVVRNLSTRLITLHIHVHELCQFAVLRSCFDHRWRSHRKMLANMSFRRFKPNETGWGWIASDDMIHPDGSIKDALSRYKDKSPKSCIELLALSYRFISMMIENEALLDLPSDAWIGALTPCNVTLNEIEALSDILDHGCVQELIRSHLDQKKRSLSSEPSIRHFHTDGASSPIDCFESPVTRTVLDQRELLAELNKLEIFLRSTRQTGSLPAIVRMEELARCLLQFVRPNHLVSIREAASRCMGELDLNTMEANLERSLLDSISTEQLQWLDDSILSNNLIEKLLMRCLEVLVESIRSPDFQVALCAAETLKAASQYIIPFSNTITMRAISDMLRLFQSPTKDIHKGPFLLSKQDRDCLRRSLDIPVDKDEPGWCWQCDVWHSQARYKESFDDWICKIVPAVIICCFDNNPCPFKDRREESLRSFLKVCQRLSRLDPTFASAIFPLLFLSLLDDRNFGEIDMKGNGVQMDTWLNIGPSHINEKISQCFTVVLDYANQDQKIIDYDCEKKVEIIIEFLDMLRKLTLHRFLQSKHHKRNSRKLKSTSNRKDSNFSNSENSEQSGNWHNIPYGIVLRLDCIKVSRAMMASKRFASAIFYAEFSAEALFYSSKHLMYEDNIHYRPLNDISGYLPVRRASDGKDLNPALDQMKVLDILLKSYDALGEHDARLVIQRKISDINYLTDPTMLRHHVEGCFTDGSDLLAFQSLDRTGLCTDNTANSHLTVASYLANADLRCTLQTYIAGVYAENDQLLDESYHSTLRAYWYECALTRMVWSDEFYNADEMKNQQCPSIDAIIDCGDGLQNDQLLLNESLYRGFECLLKGEDRSCSIQLENARKALSEVLSIQSSSEVPMDVLMGTIGHLQFLNDLNALVTQSESIRDIIKLWGLDDENVSVLPRILTNSGSLSQGLLQEITLRVFLKRSVCRNERHIISQGLKKFLWLKIEGDSRSSKIGSADGALQRLRSLECLHDELSVSSFLALKLHEAKLFEAKGDFMAGISHLKQVIAKLSRTEGKHTREDQGVLSEALLTCGNFMAKYKVEPGNSILQTYLRPAARMTSADHSVLASAQAGKLSSKAFLAVGYLAATMYEHVSKRISSLEWIKAGENLEERKLELQTCEAVIRDAKRTSEHATKEHSKVVGNDATIMEAKIKSMQVYQLQLEREINNSSTQRTKITSSLIEYRILAIESLASALTVAFDDKVSSGAVYKLVSLWTSCKESDSDFVQLNEAAFKIIMNVPSYRFVPLTNQLFSRLDIDRHTSSTFQHALHALVQKMCTEHPYHCLQSLVTLSNGRKVGSGINGHNASTFLENTNDQKVETAQMLLRCLGHRDASGKMGSLIENYITLSNCYIDLAFTPTEEFHNKSKKILFSEAMKGIHIRLDTFLGKIRKSQKSLPAILTKVPPIRPKGDYLDESGELIGSEFVNNFDAHFCVTDGGIHRPKIVVCLGTKGGSFKQLVKGEDEIRQDAVMEQIFVYVNELMMRRHAWLDDNEGWSSKSTGSRTAPLRLYTYTIVPLSPASGVLEWVEDTIPFGDFIIDKFKPVEVTGAHSRYYPGEWSAVVCRQQLKDAPPDKRRMVFDQILENHSPVFRFFFMEKFWYSSQAWYTARMRYTRSVAINSIVGHILGIGDRHASNILVHQNSGEVVHIDFGIVFEQGKILTTPERVPFRLTQNTVDGFGPIGTDGPFTTVAQTTLRVLRENTEGLMTILSAIVSDPLYRWSVSPAKARMRQQFEEKDVGGSTISMPKDLSSKNDDTPSDQNEAAQQAITKVHEKLQGYEDGTSGEQQSIEGQVQFLINSARNPDLLCEMFPGWTPWM